MINTFVGEFEFLSNFSQSPIICDGRSWMTVEHIYQASKTLDETEREQIRLAATPEKAKRMGRKVSQRHDWELIKQNIMLESVRMKFLQNRDLQQLLIETGDVDLIEGNTWHDNIWGDCRCQECSVIQGSNLLGKILMQVRDACKNTPRLHEIVT